MISRVLDKSQIAFTNVAANCVDAFRVWWTDLFVDALAFIHIHWAISWHPTRFANTLSIGVDTEVSIFFNTLTTGLTGLYSICKTMAFCIQKCFQILNNVDFWKTGKTKYGVVCIKQGIMLKALQLMGYYASLWAVFSNFSTLSPSKHY